ncbi:MAG: hypothetical protein U5K69_19500 [Balneolaceae bacterium]|nr:hypothetical protein [Balneolaceae bacterium]
MSACTDLGQESTQPESDVVEYPGPDVYYESVWGSSTNNVMAVGSKGGIMHFNGTSWTQMESTTSRTLKDVWGTSADNVYALGSGGTMSRILTVTEIRQSIKSGTNEGLYGIWGNFEDNLYAVGVDGVITHYDGTNWSHAGVITKWNLKDIWGSRDRVFIVGGFGTLLEIDLQ